MLAPFGPLPFWTSRLLGPLFHFFSQRSENSLSFLRHGRQAGMVFILVTVFIDVLGIGIIIPILPELIKEFVGGSTPLASRYFGIIAATYAATQFIFAPILGSLSDRFGRRPIILISLFGLGVDYLIQGFAPTIGWLFVGRFVAGIMGASFTTANAYIADVSGPGNRAKSFGLVGVAFGLGSGGSFNLSAAEVRWITHSHPRSLSRPRRAREGHLPCPSSIGSRTQESLPGGSPADSQAAIYASRATISARFTFLANVTPDSLAGLLDELGARDMGDVA